VRDEREREREKKKRNQEESAEKAVDFFKADLLYDRPTKICCIFEFFSFSVDFSKEKYSENEMTF